MPMTGCIRFGALHGKLQVVGFCFVVIVGIILVHPTFMSLMMSLGLSVAVVVCFVFGDGQHVLVMLLEPMMCFIFSFFCG